MKLTPDCVRDILLYLENNLVIVNSNEFSEISLNQIQEALSEKYTEEDVMYNVYQLHQAHFISGKIYNHGSYILSLCIINEITFAGHQFLETIRPETIWQKTKTSLGKTGSYAFNVLTQVAQNIAIETSKEIALNALGVK